MAIRAVKGGGIQYDEVVEVDDWVLVNDRERKITSGHAGRGLMRDHCVVKRKSQTQARGGGVSEVNLSGRKPRSRWYMST